MEYKRKSRWANYATTKCKEYLRNDFSHECSYCKIQEKEVGLIDSGYFEIDHFKPQSDSDKSFNHHLYSNLYYSCEKCNGEKGDTWSELLLDPCKDDIFCGLCPSVIGGYNSASLYKYVGSNAKGVFYISTFKLNSRHHIRIRKRRIHRKNNIRIIDELVDEILHKFSIKKNICNLDKLIDELDNLRSDKKQELLELSCDENFEGVLDYLSRLKIKASAIFEEYNMDFKIKIESDTYYCELFVDNLMCDNDEKLKFIDKERLKVWHENLNYKFGILYYYPKLDKLYFYPVSKIITKESLIHIGVKKQIKLLNDFLLESQNSR